MDQKVLILSYQHYEVLGQLFVLFSAVSRDSNKDDKLTDEDYNALYTYNIQTHELHEFSFEGMGLVDYYIPYDSDEVILRFAVDKNNDGEINTYQEPSYLKQLNLKNYQIDNFTDDQMLEQMQKLID